MTLLSWTGRKYKLPDWSRLSQTVKYNPRLWTFVPQLTHKPNKLGTLYVIVTFVELVRGNQSKTGGMFETNSQALVDTI